MSNYTSLLENKVFTIGVFVFLLFIYICFGLSSLFGVFGELSYNNFGNLTIPSLFIFLATCTLAILNEKYYFSLLIFVVVAFPSPIDDIFPSVLITNPSDKGTAAFPLITRIDIYLLLGIILKLFKLKFKTPAFKLTIPIKLFILLFIIVFITNIFKSQDVLDFNLLLPYSYHIRYFILFLFLVQLFDIKKYKNQIVISFVLCLIFLLIEAYINTKLNGLDRLSSGSLALNTFANITSAIAVYIIYLLKNKSINKILGVFGLIIAVIIMIGSGTRGAFVSLFLSLLFLNITENPKKLFSKLLKLGIIGVLLILTYLHFYNKEMIPDRYSHSYLMEKIDIDFSKNTAQKIFDIERSWETNSLVTRLSLFDSSIKMIKENPLTGIGAGRWNRYKNKYSYNYSIDKVLLDPHNDYFALLSQYGIILGLLFGYVVFFYPYRLIKKINIKKPTPLTLLYVISVTMGIAAISNAGFFKHQIAGLLLFCLCVSNKMYFENENV